MTSEKKTLRLLMPQWQGGNNPIYYLGAQLLYWLAPKGDADFAEVPVAAPDGSQLPLEGGVLGKSAILKQNQAARIGNLARAFRRLSASQGRCSAIVNPTISTTSALLLRRLTTVSKSIVPVGEFLN